MISHFKERQSFLSSEHHILHNKVKECLHQLSTITGHATQSNQASYTRLKSSQKEAELFNLKQERDDIYIKEKEVSSQLFDSQTKRLRIYHTLNFQIKNMRKTIANFEDCVYVLKEFNDLLKETQLK